MNLSLLNEILCLMKDGRVCSKESLVSALGTSTAMADVMIAHLIRAGFLEEIGGDSARDLCALCDQSRRDQAHCAVCRKAGRALLLTAKGMKAMARPSGSLNQA
jgi:hypothetical protein